ncbi:SMI1/KNR4 family protein [Oceanospirillum beijerinckii]|uniref:SMI1/KNR4 family protein n=1 Tax=Oceanospirillum beijerinckii TaxID=64976 RepID=UPI000486C32F|nr:SMI1/KNR4 family protein [Oceanospirillum beijerinckii]
MSNKLIVQELNDFFSLHKDIFIGGKGVAEDISLAEKVLGTSFPESFKLYLLEWKNISFGHHEFLGLTNNNDFIESGYPNFVWFTLEVRKDSALDNSYVVFKNINNEIYYCIDTSNTDKDIVVEWDNINKCKADEFECSILDFIKEDLEEYYDL